jgi:hypothetical protein
MLKNVEVGDIGGKLLQESLYFAPCIDIEYDLLGRDNLFPDAATVIIDMLYKEPSIWGSKIPWTLHRERCDYMAVLRQEVYNTKKSCLTSSLKPVEFINLENIHSHLPIFLPT